MRYLGWITVVGILVGFGWGATESLAGKGKGGGGGTVNTTPPDIAFTLNHDLYVIQDDGTGMTKLVAGFVAHPAWSPDGTQIAFVGNLSGTGLGHGLYVVGADGADLQKVCSVVDSSRGYGISWSPVVAADGEYKIAFCDEPDGDGRSYVYLVNTDGTELMQVGAGWDCWWSPDSTQLATQGLGGTLRFQSFTVDQGRLVPDWSYDHVFSESGWRVHGWSRGGDRLCLTQLVSSGGKTLFDIFSMDTADLDAPPVNLTQTATIEELWPSWSPDDTQLVYVAGAGLWIRDLETGSVVQLHGFPKSQAVRHPAWR